MLCPFVLFQQPVLDIQIIHATIIQLARRLVIVISRGIFHVFFSYFMSKIPVIFRYPIFVLLVHYGITGSHRPYTIYMIAENCLVGPLT